MAPGVRRAETGMAISRPAVKAPQKSDTAVAATLGPSPAPCAAYVYSHVPKQFSACAAREREPAQREEARPRWRTPTLQATSAMAATTTST